MTIDITDRGVVVRRHDEEHRPYGIGPYDDAEHVAPLPETFRFVDPNPWRPGASYSASRYAELPQYAAQLIPVTPQIWDQLVRADETDRVLDVWRSVSLVWLRGWLAERAHDLPPEFVCPECWGSGVCPDADGSITGTYGALYPCGCGESWRADIAEADRVAAWSTACDGRTTGSTAGWPGAGVLA